MYEIHEQVGTKWCVIQKYIGRYSSHHSELKIKSKIGSMELSEIMSVSWSTICNKTSALTTTRLESSPPNS